MAEDAGTGSRKLAPTQDAFGATPWRSSRDILRLHGKVCPLSGRAWLHRYLPCTRRVGDALRELRAERNVSQEAVALEAGLNRGYDSGIERCVRNVALANIVKMQPPSECQPQRLCSAQSATSIAAPDSRPCGQVAEPRGSRPSESGLAETHALQEAMHDILDCGGTRQDERA